MRAAVLGATGFVGDGESTRGALEGVDVAYHLVHSLGARNYSVPLTTLRAAVVVGRGSAAFETIVALVDRLPMMVAPRWVSTPTQPIALTDTVRYLTGVAGRTEALGESFDVGGRR